MDKEKVWNTGLAQLAIDFNTSPERIQEGGVIFTPLALNPGRRAYSDQIPFFEMVTVGAATVIMADKSLWPALREWSKDADEPHWLFEFPRMQKLAEILSPYGFALTQTIHHYLPTRDFRPAQASAGLTLQWLEQKDIAAYYPNEAWPNALQSEENSARPDM
ncbi:MAG: hypothetical protein K2P33_04425, partial [Acutalibacter sp.]|nr:hypothetical protein [Acutalibacter sp.]